MGNIPEFTKYLESQRIVLTLAGGNIRYSAPGPLDPALKESIRQNKAEMILHLRYRHIVRRGGGDFTQLYRPRRISEMTGNEIAKVTITNAFKEARLPHTMLFHGISGTGKTTLAKIIAMGLLCKRGPMSEPCCECRTCKTLISRQGSLSVLELNAVDKVKDDFRQILQEFHWYGLGSIEGVRNSVLIIDECHGLTKDQGQLFLKYLEEVSSEQYYIFCTTEYDRVLPTLRDRCTLQIGFREIPADDLKQLLLGICYCEGIEPNDKVIASVIQNSEGKPRRAVNALQQRYHAGELKKLQQC